jgi:hypothetical protein
VDIFGEVVKGWHWYPDGAALAAVRTYHHPRARFKSQTFIVLMTIAWTYLLHGY